jgi:MoaA/NifB/PqqE/SkfB family radical SAM enzyme
MSELTGGEPPVSGTVQLPTIQLHPSLWCNLRCRHCYSSSSPQTRIELDASTVCDTLTDAAAMGYRVAAVSGGEPLMYQELPRVLGHAKSVGLRTSVTTNGSLLQQRRLAALEGLVDILAISLDGPEELHNTVRGSPRAFAQLAAGLERVRRANLRFGFIHTLTRESWQHLPWLAAFAVEHGASLVQVHPLERAGRAEYEMDGLAPDEDALNMAFLLAFALGLQFQQSLTIQVDLLHRSHLLDNPELVYASDPGNAQDAGAEAASLLSVLVLEADGSLVPVSYGISREFLICNVRQERLGAAWANYRSDGYPRFRRLCRRVFDDLCAPGMPDLFNWHEALVAGSHEGGARRELLVRGSVSPEV